MSSRSIGVTKVVLRRRTTSRVMASPACSRSRICCTLGGADRVVEGHLLQHSRRGHDVSGLLLEEIEEVLIAGQEPEHGSSSPGGAHMSTLLAAFDTGWPGG